jgi:hypothetical protein
MAITAISPFWYPHISDPSPDTGSGSLTSGLLNASGDKYAFVFRCPKSGTLDKAEFLLSAVGNNPDNGIRVSFQTVDATTGLPDGTQDEYRDITGTLSAGWQVPGLMTSDGTDVGTKRTVTVNDTIAVVIEFVSFVASDSVSVGLITTITNNGLSLSAYNADATTGTYSKASGSLPIVALKYDDGTYAIPVTGTVACFPLTAYTATSFNSSSTPDEYAVRFQLPIAARIVGLWARVDPNDDFDLVLYNGTTAERTISFDKDILRSTAPGLLSGYFSSSYDVSANTTYRIAIKPTTTTNIITYRWSATNNTLLGLIPGGIEWYESTRTDAGSWTDADSNRPFAGLIISGWETGSGSGSSGGSFTFVG